MLHVARDEMCVAGKSRAVENLVLGVGELRVNIRRLCQFARGDDVIFVSMTAQIMRFARQAADSCERTR